jgi:hypothetical protein
VTHVELYSSSIASGTALLQVNAVQSNIYPTTNNGFLVQNLHAVSSVTVIASGAIRGQLQSASLRVQPFIDIVPVNRSTGAESPTRFTDFTQAPLQVKSNEELDFFGAQNSGGSVYLNAIVQFTDGPIRPAASTGAITVHATASATVTAHAWTAVTFALDTSLDPGTYSVIGMRAYSATGIVARLIPNSGSQTYRPGVPMVQAYDTTDWKYARYGAGGQLITFATTALPQVEIYATSADTAEELWLDLVQVSSSVTG